MVLAGLVAACFGGLGFVLPRRALPNCMQLALDRLHYALYDARNRDLVHRQWMARSYAVSLPSFQPRVNLWRYWSHLATLCAVGVIAFTLASLLSSTGSTARAHHASA